MPQEGEGALLPHSPERSSVQSNIPLLIDLKWKKPFISRSKDVGGVKPTWFLYHHCLSISTNQENFSSNSITDMMDIMIQARMHSEENSADQDQKAKMLSDENILATIGDMLGAGVETTASVLHWTVAFLLHKPQVGIPLFLVPAPPGPHQVNPCSQNEGRENTEAPYAGRPHSWQYVTLVLGRSWPMQ